MNLFERFSHNRNLIAAIHDTAMAAISFLLALYLRLNDDQLRLIHHMVAPGVVLFSLVCLGSFHYMRLYRGLWRYASMQDVIAIIKSVSLAILVFAALCFIINRLEGLPRSVLFINWMLLLFLLSAPRFAYRALRDRTFSLKLTLDEERKIPVLLIGGNDAAELFIRGLARESMAPYEVVGIADNDPQRKNRYIHRVPIYGGTDILPVILRKLKRKNKAPQKLILTDDRISGEQLEALLAIAEEFGLPLARLPRVGELKHNTTEARQLRPIAVEDLLGRVQNMLDKGSMQKLVQGHRVMVTGAGGTIGGELTRQVASYHPSELVLLESSEFNLYQIEREIRGSFPDVALKTLLCDVRNTEHVASVFAACKPQLVFHAAAIKHVPIAEFNIEEAILTNVFGSRNIAEACLAHDAHAMVMISTDKAVNPTNVMGASKRLAESYCQALGERNRGTGTKFVTVRFGNVLGSTGSVVPLFQEQLSKGGPLTITHPEMTRYFMTVREAVGLVLQAAVLGVGSDRQESIFVLDMGKPVKIVELARQMILLAGLRPEVDIQITYTGLRPGEKLFEELFHFSENMAKTSHESIFLASPRFCDMEQLRASLEALFAACRTRDAEEALSLLKQLVPEFEHAKNL